MPSRSHDGRPTLRWHRDEAAITRAACSDGIYALATNLPGPLTAEAVLRLYKGQPVVERRHHEAKSVLRVRPVFLHNDDRIAALVSVVGLALLVFSLIEADIRRRLGPEEELPGLLPEGRAARPTGRTILGAFPGLRPDLHAAGHPTRPAHGHAAAPPRPARHPPALPHGGEVTLPKCGKRD